MEYLAQFKIDDLSYENSEFTFILESPHKDEVNERVPAAGESGQWMSKILFNIEAPLGTLVAQNINTIPKISILNCSRLPLQKSCYNPSKLTPDYLDFLDIQGITNSNVQIAKGQIKEKLRTKLGLQALQSFRCRLLSNIQNSSAPKIIVCGVLAQCFFEKATELQGYLRRSTQLSWEGSSFRVFYEYHPSPRSGQWQNPENMRKLLEFVS